MSLIIVIVYKIVDDCEKITCVFKGFRFLKVIINIFKLL